MNIELITIVSFIVIITLSYKLVPFRQAGPKKPRLAIFPKYKLMVNSNLNDVEREKILGELGFNKTKNSGSLTKYTRGSTLGDLSIKLSKVNITLNEMDNKKLEVTIQAGWVAAFDTGDHWQFITELGQKLKRA